MGVSLLEVKMFQRESKHLLIFIFCPVSLVGKKKSVLAEPESRTCVHFYVGCEAEIFMTTHVAC